MELILSTFCNGIDIFGRGFAESGFCVVQAGDIKTGQDIRDFRAPSGKFDGVIGGTCCQNFSGLNRNPNREAGIELLNEFCRVVREAAPKWFLMENVPNVPNIAVEGYTIQRFNLSPRECGNYGQIRNRAFQFGFTEGSFLNIKRDVSSVKKQSCVTATEGRRTERRTFADVCELQGLPRDFNIEGFTQTARYDAVGNAVHLAVARRIATTIRERATRNAANSETLCACQCGRLMTGMRSDAVVATASCRKRIAANAKREAAQRNEARRETLSRETPVASHLRDETPKREKAYGVQA